MQIESTVYYWASWKQVAMVTACLGALIWIPIYADGQLNSLADGVRGNIASLVLMLVTVLILGTTFFRIKYNRLYYTSSLFQWSSMDIADITTIRLVPRFFFTNKVTAVQIEKRNPGIFPGMLLSRDAFPDQKIAALVSHLKRINPSIFLDEGVQDILQSQKVES